MMPEDNLQHAQEEAETFKGLPVAHMWDPKGQLGKLFSKTLRLRATAWDVYLLYKPGVTWEGSQPPEPTFWMHQLPADMGADWRAFLNSAMFSQQLLTLLGENVEPGWMNLGLLLHEKGILTVARERSAYSLADIHQVLEESKR